MSTKPATITVAFAVLMSGCSSLPGGPAQYMALPTGVDLNAISIAEADATKTRAEWPELPRAVSVTVGRGRSAGIDPLVILQAQASLWPVTPRAERIKVARAPSMTDPGTTATITEGRSRRTEAGIQDYDREAVMERLFARGKRAVLPICEGC